MVAELERRAAAVEIRTAGGRKLEGYAATFGSEARMGSIVETIAAGAFAASLADGSDKLALVDHDPARLLARTRSGTLRLVEDTRGLAFSLDAPDTPAGRDVLALAERGDLGGMSFAFRVRPDGERWSGQRRELRSVDLAEISVISSFPAYPDTSIAARHRPREQPLDATLRRALLRWRA
jgi:HK97 family phage prohead protease